LYNKYPFDDRKHGWKGIYENYRKAFGVETEEECYNLLKLLHNYKGHLPCYCGTGKKVRNCCAEKVRQLRNQNISHDFGYDVKAYLADKKKVRDGKNK
jgi:hypothetical protein